MTDGAALADRPSRAGRPRLDVRFVSRCFAVVGLILVAGCGPSRFRGQETTLSRPPIPAPTPLPPGASPPVVEHRTTMVLPQGWMLRDLVAQVRLRVAVDVHGMPRQAEVIAVDGPVDIRGRLGDIAAQTVKGWRFWPALIDEAPVPAWAEVALDVDLAAWWAAVHDAPAVPELPPGVTPPKRIGTVELVWPAGRRPRTEGRHHVVVVVEVGADGTTGAVWIAESTGERAFELAVLEGLRHQRFEPARDPAGRPLRVRRRLRFDVEFPRT